MWTLKSKTDVANVLGGFSTPDKMTFNRGVQHHTCPEVTVLGLAESRILSPFSFPKYDLSYLR